MEKNRKNYNAKESGIALVTALMLVAGSALLVAGIAYVMIGSWKIATINKQYATVQEAAAGGAQHAAEVIRVINNDGSTTSMGVMDSTAANDVIYYCNTANPGAVIRAKTADGRYTINATVKCLSLTPIPGSGGALIFPPPPSFGSGGSMPAFYVFYSVVSDARDNDNNAIGKVESVYRLAR